MFDRKTLRIIIIFGDYIFHIFKIKPLVPRTLNLRGSIVFNFIFKAGWKTKPIHKMSQDIRFPTIWYVLPAKPKISLHIRAV